MRGAGLAGLALLLEAGCGDVAYSVDEPWPDPALACAGEERFLVTNSGEDTVSWLRYDTLAPCGPPLPVGRIAAEREGAHHGAAAPDGRSYYVGLSNYVPGSGGGPHGSHGLGTVPGWLLRYDAVTGERIAAWEVDRNPGDVRITSDGRLVLQSHFDLQKIQEAAMQPDWTLEDMIAPLAVVDTTTGERRMVDVCPAGHGIGLAAGDVEAYVACYATDELAVVSLADLAVERFPIAPGAAPNPLAPAFAPYAAAVNPADGSVWVSCLRISSPPGELRRFDPATRTWDPEPILVSGPPFFGAFTPDGAWFVVAIQGNGAIAVVDTATKTVATTFALSPEACVAPHAVFLHPDGQRAIVVCEGTHAAPGSIAVVSDFLGAPAVSAAYQVGVYPDDIVLVPAAGPAQ